MTYLSVQEHFRKSKTIDKYFKDQFPSYNSYVIPGFREQGQTRGRPQAGIAQLSRANVGILKNQVHSNSSRVQAQILNFSASKLLWINAYFPCDPQTEEFDDIELISVLNEIERILDTAQFDDVLVCADMNWDMSRTGGFSVTVRRFLDRLSLCSLWETHHVDFTHVHTDLSSVSTLDHFVCNERLLPFVKSCGVMHFGDNPSRHSPIMLKLNLGGLPVRKRPDPIHIRRPSWYKATTNQCEAFKVHMQNKLDSLPVPACINCENVKCPNQAHWICARLTKYSDRDLARHHSYGRRPSGCCQAGQWLCAGLARAGGAAEEGLTVLAQRVAQCRPAQHRALVSDHEKY